MPRVEIPTDIVKADERESTAFDGEVDVHIEIYSFRYNAGFLRRLIKGDDEYFKRQVKVEAVEDWNASVSTVERTEDIGVEEQIEQTIEKFEERVRKLQDWGDAVL